MYRSRDTNTLTYAHLYTYLHTKTPTHTKLHTHTIAHTYTNTNLYNVSSSKSVDNLRKPTLSRFADARIGFSSARFRSNFDSELRAPVFSFHGYQPSRQSSTRTSPCRLPTHRSSFKR